MSYGRSVSPSSNAPTEDSDCGQSHQPSKRLPARVVGIVGTVAVGVVAFDESVDLAGVVGLTLVVGGVLVLNLFSDAYSPAA